MSDRAHAKRWDCPRQTRDEAMATGLHEEHEDPKQQEMGCVAHGDREECDEQAALTQVSRGVLRNGRSGRYAIVDRSHEVHEWNTADGTLHEEDVIEMYDSVRTTFTFADNT